MAAKTLYQFKGQNGITMYIKSLNNAYYVQEQRTKKAFIYETLRSKSYGRLSHALTEFWNWVGEYIENDYNSLQEEKN